MIEMRNIKTSGATVDIPDKCDCGAVPTDAEAVAYVKSWNELAHTCSFCGIPIQFISGLLEHVHAEPKKSNAWAIQRPVWEPYISCYHGLPDYSVDIYAHIPCAKMGLPFLNWTEQPPLEDVYPDVEPPDITIEAHFR